MPGALGNNSPHFRTEESAGRSESQSQESSNVPAVRRIEDLDLESLEWMQRALGPVLARDHDAIMMDTINSSSGSSSDSSSSDDDDGDSVDGSAMSTSDSSDSSSDDDDDSSSDSSQDENNENNAIIENKQFEDSGNESSTRHLSSSVYCAPVVPLKFVVCQCDGGDFSSRYPVYNVLRNDASVYCSNRVSNVNIVFKYQPNEYASDAMFTLKSFVIKAPQSGYTAPCKEGIIFVSNDPIDPKDTVFFNDFTRHKFTQWIAKRSRVSASSNEQHNIKVEPIAFFQLNQCTNFITTHELYMPTSGRYVMLKLLRPSSPNPSRIPFNIDLQYAGFRGYPGKRSISYGDIN